MTVDAPAHPSTALITAPEVPGSRFHGHGRQDHDPAAVLDQARRVAPTLAGDVEVRGIEVADDRLVVTRYDGTSFVVVLASAPVRTDTVAETSLDPDGTPRITFSDLAADPVVERALANQVAGVLALLDGDPGQRDMLRPGAAPDPGAPRELSAYDRGRVAELRNLARRNAVGRAWHRPSIRSEMRVLVDHLGLRVGVADADVRRARLEPYLLHTVDQLAVRDHAERRAADHALGVPALPTYFVKHLVGGVPPGLVAPFGAAVAAASLLAGVPGLIGLVAGLTAAGVADWRARRVVFRTEYADRLQEAADSAAELYRTTAAVEAELTHQDGERESLHRQVEETDRWLGDATRLAAQRSARGPLRRAATAFFGERTTVPPPPAPAPVVVAFASDGTARFVPPAKRPLGVPRLPTWYLKHSTSRLLGAATTLGVAVALGNPASALLSVPLILVVTVVGPIADRWLVVAERNAEAVRRGVQAGRGDHETDLRELLDAVEAGRRNLSSLRETDAAVRGRAADWHATVRPARRGWITRAVEALLGQRTASAAGTTAPPPPPDASVRSSPSPASRIGAARAAGTVPPDTRVGAGAATVRRAAPPVGPAAFGPRRPERPSTRLTPAEADRAKTTGIPHRIRYIKKSLFTLSVPEVVGMSVLGMVTGTVAWPVIAVAAATVSSVATGVEDHRFRLVEKARENSYRARYEFGPGTPETLPVGPPGGTPPSDRARRKAEMTLARSRVPRLAARYRKVGVPALFRAGVVVGGSVVAGLPWMIPLAAYTVNAAVTPVAEQWLALREKVAELPKLDLLARQRVYDDVRRDAVLRPVRARVEAARRATDLLEERQAAIRAALGGLRVAGAPGGRSAAQDGMPAAEPGPNSAQPTGPAPTGTAVDPGAERPGPAPARRAATGPGSAGQSRALPWWRLTHFGYEPPEERPRRLDPGPGPLRPHTPAPGTPGPGAAPPVAPPRGAPDPATPAPATSAPAPPTTPAPPTRVRPAPPASVPAPTVPVPAPTVPARPMPAPVVPAAPLAPDGRPPASVRPGDPAVERTRRIAAMMRVVERHVLVDGEVVVSIHVLPDGSGIALGTDQRRLWIRFAPEWAIGALPGVHGVVLVTSEEHGGDGRPETYGILLFDDGSSLALHHPTAAAHLGRWLAHGLGIVAFAEVLLGWHPATADPRDLILDPQALWRLFGQPDLPAFPAPSYRHTDAGGVGTFFSWQLRSGAAEPANVLDVYAWTVWSRPDEPADWSRRRVLTGVPVDLPAGRVATSP